jgi:hypothetical protein
MQHALLAGELMCSRHLSLPSLCPSDQQQGQPPSLAPFRCAQGVRHNACEEDMLSQHHRRSPGICYFCAAPNIDVVHPGETAMLLVRFRIGVIFIRLIVYVCCFVFVLWRRGTPCFAWRRRQAARRSLMFVAMHKSESPSSLQTPIGFVYGEPMHVALDRLV